MNREDPYRDQAEKLRQRVERNTFEEGQVVEREELPPRSRLHHEKRKKNKWKLKYPVIRLLVLFFILLPITIFSIYSTIAKDRIGDAKKTVGDSSEGFEIIDIETADHTNDDGISKEDIEKEDESGAASNETQDQIVEESLDPQQNTNQPLQAGESISQDPLTGVKQTGATPIDTVYHTVQPGETIYRISMKYYKSKLGIDTIKSANNLTNNEIRVGQVLTIPLNK